MSRIICRLCRIDTDKRFVLKEKPQEEVEVSSENRRIYGLIREVICKNIIRRYKHLIWNEEPCDTHLLKLKGGRNEP